MAIPIYQLWHYPSIVGIADTTIVHNLGFIPRIVIPVIRNAAAHYVSVISVDAVNFHLIADAADLIVDIYVMR